MSSIIPYKEKEGTKREQVEAMFDNISGKYDFLNHFLSAGVDVYWRKKAVRMLKRTKPGLILDIATGTGDFAIEAMKLKPRKIIGVDISEGMLNVGREKIKRRGMDQTIEMLRADSESLPFEDNYFDAVIVSFGVRNFENLSAGLTEMNRVLKNEGTCLIIEFSKPKVFPFKQLYSLYFTYVLPLIGKFVSKDKSAYTYLPESVRQFPDGQDFLGILHSAGYKNTKCIPLTFGICSIYLAQK